MSNLNYNTAVLLGMGHDASHQHTDRAAARGKEPAPGGHCRPPVPQGPKSVNVYPSRICLTSSTGGDNDCDGVLSTMSDDGSSERVGENGGNCGVASMSSQVRPQRRTSRIRPPPPTGAVAAPARS